MSKRSKACEFPRDVRERIEERDGGCIFCKMGYKPDPEDGPKFYGIMHLVGRAQGGLGVEENGAVGCQWHHNLLDNGNGGERQYMRSLFIDYLKMYYEDWNIDDLYYKKWR